MATRVKNIGPLDWRVPIVNTLGQPTAEFQRRWNTQRDNNELITVIILGDGVPVIDDPEAIEGTGYIDTSTDPYTFWIAFEDDWHKVGPSDFTDLLDTPNDYTGFADNLVQVNPTEDGLDFVALADLTDDPTAVASDVAVNGTADTFMRSDAAPAVQVGSDTQLGLLQVDGTSITATAGVIETALGDAPSDGIPYVRQDATWTKLGSSFGFGVVGETQASGGVGDIYTLVVPYDITFADDYPLCFAKATVAATGSTVFTINKNGSAAGTITFSAAGTVGAWLSTGAQTYAAGDILTILAPNTPDATLANIGFTFVGTRD